MKKYEEIILSRAKRLAMIYSTYDLSKLTKIDKILIEEDLIRYIYLCDLKKNKLNNKKYITYSSKKNCTEISKIRERVRCWDTSCVSKDYEKNGNHYSLIDIAIRKLKNLKNFSIFWILIVEDNIGVCVY